MASRRSHQIEAELNKTKGNRLKKDFLLFKGKTAGLSSSDWLTVLTVLCLHGAEK